MRKIFALTVGCLISAYLCNHWHVIANILGSKLSYVLMVYAVALGVIHLGGIFLKILAAIFVIIDPIADNYCYWYENTNFYKWLHHNDKHKY